jgi:hypothetical protein
MAHDHISRLNKKLADAEAENENLKKALALAAKQITKSADGANTVRGAIDKALFGGRS